MASDFKMICDSMNSPAAIHLVSPQQFDSGTAQTPGSERRAAIAPSLGIASTIWGGLFEVEPRSRTGVHHHGEQETIAYVLLWHLRNPLGCKRRMARAREGWRLHSRPRLAAAYGNQPFETRTVSMGRGAQHSNTDRIQPSGRHLAASLMSCGGLLPPNLRTWSNHGRE